MIKPSLVVKGIPRKEWMRQIAKLPRKYSPKGMEAMRQKARMLRQKQMEKNGALFGKVNERYVAEKARQKNGVNLSEYRQAQDDYK